MKTKTRKNGFVIAIALLAMIALVGSAQAAANLQVTKAIDPGYVFSNLTNVWSAQVTNTGDQDSNAGVVNITITSDATGNQLYTYDAAVVAIPASSTVVVSLGTWKPTKVENITVNVTADYSNTTIESDETDNLRIETRNTTGAGCYDTTAYINRMLEKECFGYRGQHPLTEKLVGGSDIIYTVGDYKYLSAYVSGSGYVRHNYSVNFTLGEDVNRVDSTCADIPAGATIKEARLYLYYNSWRRDTLGLITDNSNMTFVAGACSPDLANEVAADDLYTDFKNYSTTKYGKDREYGTIAYDVTSVVTGNGNYCGYFINDESGSPRLAFSGMALLVVYDDGSSKVYRIAEGLDRLATQYKVSANKKYSYHVVPESATTSATLTDANPCGDVTDANLFTVTVDGVHSTTGNPTDESQKVNNCPWYAGAWDNDGLGSGSSYPLGFSRTEVTGCLSAATAAETVQYRETDMSAKYNGFSAVLAVLIAEREVIPVYIDIRPGSCPNPLNLESKSKGVLPVAVLGTAEFDVTTIDPETLILTREGLGGVGVEPIRWSYKDIATPFTGELCDCHDLNGDGILDLTLKFDIQELVETLKLSDEAGNTIPLTLTGNLNEENCGKPIKGEDCIRVLE